MIAGGRAAGGRVAPACPTAATAHWTLRTAPSGVKPHDDAGAEDGQAAAGTATMPSGERMTRSKSVPPRGGRPPGHLPRPAAAAG